MAEAPRPDEILVMMAIADRGGCSDCIHTPGRKIVAQFVDTEAWQPRRRPDPIPSLIDPVFRALREHVFAAVNGS